MKTNSTFQININEPCHENWNSMSPTERGAFCAVCSKEVTDFTTFSDEELLAYFKRNEERSASKSGSGCGRFQKSQLGKTYNLSSVPNPTVWKRLVAFVTILILPLILFTKKALGQSCDTVSSHNPKFNESNGHRKSALKKDLKCSTYKGKAQFYGVVKEEETGETIPFANIVFYKDNVQIGGTVTDFDGVFSFSEPELMSDPNASYTVKYQYVGYEPVTRKLSFVPDLAKQYDLSQNLSNTGFQEMMGIIIVTPDKPLRRDLGTSGNSFSGDEVRKRR